MPTARSLLLSLSKAVAKSISNSLNSILTLSSSARVFHFAIVLGLRLVVSIIGFKLCLIAERISNSSISEM